MFKDALQDIVEKTEGGIAGLLMDSSGIAIESYAKDGAPFDISVIGVEYGVLIGTIKKATQLLEAGETKEIAIATDKFITILRPLGEYFVALAIEPGGNFGKGRFLVRNAAPKFLAEL